MKTLSINVAAASLCAALALLAGCAPQSGSASVPESGSATQTRLAASGFRVVYNFQGTPDGGYPLGSLLALDGVLYGTTSSYGAHNRGTVFSVTPSGTEKVLYSFNSGTDGDAPYGGLAFWNHAFYGTTSKGGVYSGHGTVFELKEDGIERVVWSFPGSSDPRGDVRLDSDTLYGTTEMGGEANAGTVFAVQLKLDLGGTLYSFKGVPNDGTAPTAGLTMLASDFYGTTPKGGSGPCQKVVGKKKDVYGCGTVFKMTPSGREELLYSFKGIRDGALPSGDLAVLDGKLYGVTRNSGANGYGTVFEMQTDGTERIIHSFAINEGAYPQAGLTAFNGLLYGTTTTYGPNHHGSVFEISPSGTFRVLHGFDGKDGFDSESALTPLNGALYGTTRTAGTNDRGTVYEVTP
ncbi:MAG TPA: choice-of-anchor tandem repeat GloVer-containing protein [Candidatus Cybelea sp.]|jgi:uncharacterized repeat protein (TIGR03803 family)|nr:choice-of-anchor tandem repeat GloVer-containing protein [Candidatus Cybelea sp.]